jgi:hypothetical protein
MGLHPHTHEMTWRCVAIVGFDALFFCKIVARCLQKIGSSHACVDVNSLQTFTNTKASIDQPMATPRIAVFSSHACVDVNSLQMF